MTVEIIPFKSEQPPKRGHRLVKAAVHFGDRIYIDWRHSDIIKFIGKALGEMTTQDAQGFIDEEGNWYNRYQAARIAYHAGQIVDYRKTLTSEDLWDNDGTPREPGEPFDPMAG